MQVRGDEKPHARNHALTHRIERCVRGTTLTTMQWMWKRGRTSCIRRIHYAVPFSLLKIKRTTACTVADKAMELVTNPELPFQMSIDTKVYITIIENNLHGSPICIRTKSSYHSLQTQLPSALICKGHEAKCTSHHFFCESCSKHANALPSLSFAFLFGTRLAILE